MGHGGSISKRFLDVGDVESIDLSVEVHGAANLIAKIELVMLSHCIMRVPAYVAKGGECIGIRSMYCEASIWVARELDNAGAWKCRLLNIGSKFWREFRE